MREIKFRAWDGDTMVYLDKIGAYVGKGKVQRVLQGEVYDEEWPLMQYTGLKDKNGKEIYEGDILFFESSQVYSEVYFDNGCFRLKSNIEPLTHWIASFAELKGNIYENPELLHATN